MSRIVHALIAVNTSKRDRQPLSAFIPKWDKEPKKPQTVEQQIEAVKTWTLALGGKVQ